MKHTAKELETMAKCRAQTYDTLIGIFMTLPDSNYLNIMFSSKIADFLQSYRLVNHPSITKGADLITHFIDKYRASQPIENNSPETHYALLLEALSVDRTTLLRAPYKTGFNAPYESQYRRRQKSNNLQLNLRKHYLESGYIPVHTNEAMDFFCVQLDFLRVIILKTISDQGHAKELVELQLQFLQNHIASWFKDYAAAAIPLAETDFYKGWILFLTGFLELEISYLERGL